jgi:cyclohexanone monooxygenase
VTEPETIDVLVVGAGYSGLYLLHRLRAQGLSVRVVETGDGVGGTWYWNRYPGARCDVESVEYGYSFSAELDSEWSWNERYSTQPQILAYLNRVADRFDLRRDIQLNTRVVAAQYDESGRSWRVRTEPAYPESGERAELVARFCVMATGCLSKPKIPDIPGVGSFAGQTYSTSSWRREGVGFGGQRVGVIGTGSSGVQSIPVIAEQAAHLHVFQRTANYIVPAHNRDLTDGDQRPEELAVRRSNALGNRSGLAFDGGELNERPGTEVSDEEREGEFERLWRKGGLTMVMAFPDVGVEGPVNEAAAEFVHRKIREKVRDPKVAEMLIPRDHPFGAKRLCVDTGYYETFNRDNVTLVSLRETPIEEVVPNGVRTTAEQIELDALVLATGFDAMTGALTAIDIRGRAGVPLRLEWANGPRTYLGLAIAGFPNLFTVTGPGSPSVLSNMRLSIEQHVNWITDCIRYLDEHDITSIEATEAAQDSWVEHVAEVAEPTVVAHAQNWYVGANVPGKPRVFMPYIGGVPVYREICEQVATDGYQGFVLTSA